MSGRAGDTSSGLFDRSSKGQSIGPVAVQIERERIRFFAQVLGETDPIHWDVAAARSQGHPDLVAPPSFFMAIEAMANEELLRAGLAPASELIGCDFRYLLHGDESYNYGGLIYAGDVVSFSTRVLDFLDKKGGAIELAALESHVEHAERGILIRARRQLLHRLSPRAEQAK